MDNHTIAQVFGRIARLMEANGDLPFKVRAYRRVAEEFGRLAVPLSHLAAANRLRTVPGVGVAVEKKVRELLDTGSLSFYQRLIAAVPERLLELMDLPGVGPKLAGRLWRELGVTTKEELTAALDDGRVTGLPRINPATVDMLARALAEDEGRPRPAPSGVVP